MVVCPEFAKTSPTEIPLACSIGKSYGFAGFGVVPEVFVADSDQKMRFGFIASTTCCIISVYLL
jgi:hypothetical protein